MTHERMVDRTVGILPPNARVDLEITRMAEAALTARQPDATLREVCEKVVWATKARCEDYHARYKMQVLPFNGADAEHVVSSILGPRETVERVAHAGSTHSKTLPEASHE